MTQNTEPENLNFETNLSSNTVKKTNIQIQDQVFIAKIDSLAIEDLVEIKISRFFDQLGGFYPDDVYDLMLAKLEKPLMSQILRRVGGNQVQAAKILGINRNTLRKKLKTHGLV